MFRQQAVGQRPQPVLDRRQARPPFDAVAASEHSLDVAVEYGLLAAEGEGGNGSSGGAPDAGQGLDGFQHGGELATMLIGDTLCCGMQVARTRVVAQPAPVLQHFILVRGGKRGDVGKARHEAPVVGDDGRHLGLLQHDFRHPDGVGVTRVLPRQVVAAVPFLPSHHAGGKAMVRLGEGHRLRMAA